MRHLAVVVLSHAETMEQIMMGHCAPVVIHGVRLAAAKPLARRDKALTESPAIRGARFQAEVSTATAFRMRRLAKNFRISSAHSTVLAMAPMMKKWASEIGTVWKSLFIGAA